jgi:hypothetical protein
MATPIYGESFDYASVSSTGIGEVRKFSVLVMSEEQGATVLGGFGSPAVGVLGRERLDSSRPCCSLLLAVNSIWIKSFFVVHEV